MSKGKVIVGGGIIGVGLFLLLWYLARGEEPPAEYGSFYGNIISAGIPIVGKPVYIDNYQSTLSDENGYFVVDVPPGTYSTLSVEGFFPHAL